MQGLIGPAVIDSFDGIWYSLPAFLKVASLEDCRGFLIAAPNVSDAGAICRVRAVDLSQSQLAGWLLHEPRTVSLLAIL